MTRFVEYRSNSFTEVQHKLRGTCIRDSDFSLEQTRGRHTSQAAKGDDSSQKHEQSIIVKCERKNIQKYGCSCMRKPCAYTYCAFYWILLVVSSRLPTPTERFALGGLDRLGGSTTQCRAGVETTFSHSPRFHPLFGSGASRKYWYTGYNYCPSAVGRYLNNDLLHGSTLIVFFQ